ncbi:nuclease-related domain-containing protein [Virgibacillus flavescens]|uniref:nuclease-related domain-containing protein n=1 Tax=Virgibacillus flavescens TaxID=1611422 RepID=UPI003D344422
MIAKEREVPLIIPKLEALLRRIPLNHPQRIRVEEDLRKYNSGYRGEQSIDYHLNFLENDDYIIFHGLRLPWKNDFHFQIDTLLLATNCIFLLEVKNIAGTIFFDTSSQQMIRSLEEKEESYPCPILQSNRHVIQLNEWLRHHRFTNIPIIPYIIFTNSSSILKTSPSNQDVFDKIFTSASFPPEINTARKKYSSKLLNKPKIDRLTNLFLTEHREYEPDILKKFKVAPSELLSGMGCPACNKLSINRKNGKWRCQLCEGSFPVSFFQTLMDFRLLISSTISNKQFRQFTNLTSPSVATKQLLKMNFQYTGSYKNRKYQLSLQQIRDLL